MMEIDDIKKIESRKRMSTDVEKLRDKVSRETAKIIKLKVSQDTAYWDLKEKLEQVENNHERLQQNMVEVQMQREAISGQYQEELRLRPEILNKLSSTREICDVLEDYSERLKQTLSRCKADQVALCDAYQKSSAIVRDARSKQEQIDQRNRQLIESLQEKVKLVSEHHNQTVQFLTAAKQQAESELADVKAELNSMRKRSDQLLATVGDLTRDVDKYRNESVQKDKMLANIREEMNKTFEEYNKHICEARDNIINKEKELKEATDMCTSLRQALSNQEEFTKSVCDARNALQEKVASLEDGHAELITAMDQLKIQLEDTASAKAALKGEIEKETVEKNRLLKEIFDYQQVTTNSEKEIQQLRMEINSMEEKNSRLAEDLERAKCELNEKCNNIEELLDREKHLHTNIESYREATEDKIKNMEVELQNKDKEIDSKSNTINQLMSEVKTGTDARCKLEGIVQKLKKEMELAKNVAMEKQQKLEKQIEQLEVSIRDTEDKFSKQMSALLAERKEKELLQEKIDGMQQTMENVQRQLAGPILQPSREPAELDDNAVVLTPSKRAQSPIIQKKPEFAVPRPLESALYNLFSDSSAEDEAVDPSIVERRFAALARGEKLQPLPLSAFKRRSSQPHKNSPRFSKQARNIVKDTEPKFFKTKRQDSKIKNIK